jgi:hypothetical protein
VGFPDRDRVHEALHVSHGRAGPQRAALAGDTVPRAGG